MVGYVGMGSNVGDRRAHLRAGVEGLVRAGIAVSALSSVWETEPVGDSGPRWFLNAVARIETDRTPEEVLSILLRAEHERGRRRSRANAPRSLDLDLLTLGDARRSGSELTLPHPRMWSRRFVLAPLAEIAPGLASGDAGITVAEALATLDDPHDVRNLGPLALRETLPVYSRAL